MSNLDRLTKVISSWIGSFKRDPENYFGFPEARVLITRVGLGISEPRYTEITGSEVRLEDFLQQLYAAEQVSGMKMTTDTYDWVPELEAKAVEEGNRVAITGKIKGEEKILVEWSF